MPGLEEGEESHCLRGMESQFCKMKSSVDCLHKMNVLNTTELYTKNGEDNNKWTNTLKNTHYKGLTEYLFQ